MIDTKKLKAEALEKFFNSKQNESITLTDVFDAGFDAGYVAAHTVKTCAANEELTTKDVCVAVGALVGVMVGQVFESESRND